MALISPLTSRRILSCRAFGKACSRFSYAVYIAAPNGMLT